MTQTVLILGGSGKIGRNASAAFWNAGWTVRQFDRKTDDMTQAAMGADVIVNGLNPPKYHNWAELVPAMTAQIIAAAKASGATVIIPGNIYNFGGQPGTLDENTPHLPNTRKGRIRVAMEQAFAASGVQTIVLRAGNFIDPGSDDDLMALLTLREIAKGKVAHAGGADVMQAYAYVPDWARAAVMLAEQRATLAQFTDVPFPGHAFTITQLQRFLSDALRKPIKVVGFPWAIMTLLSPFWELAREMREMKYLYAMPHTIGRARFDMMLPDFVPTPLEEVMLSGLPTDIHPNKVMHASGQAIVAE